VRNCTSVPAGKFGSLDIKLNDLGTHERRLHLQHEAVTHEVTVTSNVTSLGDDGCFCTVPGVGRDPATMPAAMAALFLGLAAGVRVRRRM
jgi:MYXO-CTERM domain-containing protein